MHAFHPTLDDEDGGISRHPTSGADEAAYSQFTPRGHWLWGTMVIRRKSRPPRQSNIGGGSGLLGRTR